MVHRQLPEEGQECSNFKTIECRSRIAPASLFRDDHGGEPHERLGACKRNQHQTIELSEQVRQNQLLDPHLLAALYLLLLAARPRSPLCRARAVCWAPACSARALAWSRVNACAGLWKNNTTNAHSADLTVNFALQAVARAARAAPCLRTARHLTPAGCRRRYAPIARLMHAVHAWRRH